MSTTSKLNILYYGLYTMAVIILVVFRYVLIPMGMALIDPASQLGNMLQFVEIFITLLGVVYGLYVTKLIKKRVAPVTDAAAREEQYMAYSFIRMMSVSAGYMIGIPFFFLMGGYQSMLWCAGISFIAQFMTKPSDARQEQELSTDEIL